MNDPTFLGRLKVTRPISGRGLSPNLASAFLAFFSPREAPLPSSLSERSSTSASGTGAAVVGSMI